MTISIRPFDGPLGAEVLGVDASHPLPPEAVEAVKAALDERTVAVLRNQKITAPQMVTFTASLGELAKSVLKYAHKDAPEVSVLSNILDENGEHIGVPDAGGYWHTDGVYYREPHAYTLLYALEVPHDAAGRPLGSTQFVNVIAAYEALAPDMKEKLSALRAVHRLTRVYEPERMAKSTRKRLTEEQKAAYPDRDHPVIRTHPRTGRKCLYVNETYTDSFVGVPYEEGRKLLETLWRHCVEQTFYYLHEYRVGDLVIWDNCATQHKATFDYALPQRRLLYRTTVKGTIPV